MTTLTTEIFRQPIEDMFSYYKLTKQTGITLHFFEETFDYDAYFEVHRKGVDIGLSIQIGGGGLLLNHFVGDATHHLAYVTPQSAKAHDMSGHPCGDSIQHKMAFKVWQATIDAIRAMPRKRAKKAA
jgi:hypothetical protein